MNATISKMFDYFPGNHALTEDIIYNYQPTGKDGCIPIFSGSQDNIVPIGSIRKNAKNKKGEDVKYFEGSCLILTKDGSAGLLTYRDGGMFTINHHACVLKVKEEWEDKVDPEWFAYQYRKGLSQYVTSKSDNRVFSTKWFERILFKIPEYTAQLEQKNKKNKLDSLNEHITFLIEQLKQISTNSSIGLEIGENEILEKIFRFKGGNSGLTEEFSYSNQPYDEDKKIPILSSATLKANLMGDISKDAKPNKKPLKVFNGPCILVARNGYAGTMTYIDNGEFTTNDHAYVLTLKEDWKNKLNLRWFAYQYQELFYNLVTSKSDNATFNKEYAEKQKVKIPDKEIQDRIASKLLKIDSFISGLEDLKYQIENLIDSEII